MSDEIRKNILTEIRARHEKDQRWHCGPSMICPQSHEDRAFLLAEIARLRAERRERIATAFMAAILCREENNDVGYLNPKLVFKDAIRYADALIEELDKEAKP